MYCFIYIYVCMYVCVCVYTCVCMYMHTPHAHTHTHTLIGIKYICMVDELIQWLHYLQGLILFFVGAVRRNKMFSSYSDADAKQVMKLWLRTTRDRDGGSKSEDGGKKRNLAKLASQLQQLQELMTSDYSENENWCTASYLYRGKFNYRKMTSQALCQMLSFLFLDNKICIVVELFELNSCCMIVVAWSWHYKVNIQK